MGVFSKENSPEVNIKRNSFDLSFQNNLTMNFGKLYPAMCKEVLPGDTFEIETAFGLRFMPMPFPIQTKVRADAHFFYVRSRNLWKDFQDFYGNNDSSLSMPYIAPQNVEKFTTGSLADYLGVPTTIVGENYINGGSLDHTFDTPSSGSPRYILNPTQAWSKRKLSATNAQGAMPLYVSVPTGTGSGVANRVLRASVRDISGVVPDITNGITYRVNLGLYTESGNQHASDMYFYLTDAQDNSINGFDGAECYVDEEENAVYVDFVYSGQNPISVKNIYYIYAIPKEYVSEWKEVNSLSIADWYIGLPALQGGSVTNVGSLNQSVIEGKDYFGDLFINALPFRAYESIYNSFYRDQRNNPYVLNGKECPNEYIPTKEGGEDANEYELHRRNWEQDFLTSALPSPQMGVAPLVGISSTGVATYQSEDGTAYKVQMNTADDGDTITGATVTTNVPNDVARSIINTATQGISINDFRAVNSLQRWLEANYRKGLKYKDQLASHFGVNTSYELLDMPEFLGGCSSWCNVDQINQTSSSTDGSPLGSYAGQLSAIGSSNHKIHKYCDEPGYIICIVSVVPVPCYSQLLPKHFLKSSTLDYYFPEFGHIGFQPITYSEVCPLQQNYNGGDLNDVYGYQRPWYDYLSSTDEVHGEFRKTLRDFVLYRLFNTVPSLTPEFLTVNENQLNDIFSVTDTSDKILGQIHFNIHAKRPIPRYGIPRLE